MAIDTGKIFGDTPTEWHERTQTNPSDYIAEGIHAIYKTGMNNTNYIGDFAKNVPDNAEVVVGYNVSMGRYEAIAWGTALIPKGTKKSQ
jgi:hypothetical protein